MDPNTFNQGMRKTNIQKVTYYCFLKYTNLNHLLVIIDHTIIRLINLSNYQFKITIQYKVNHIQPIDICLQTNSNIYFLCKTCIYWLSLNQIAHKRPPKRYDNLIGQDTPKRLLILSQSQWIIVYQTMMTFVSQGQISKLINYPQVIKFTRSIIDHQFQSRNDAFVVVPRQNLKFPYVFSLRQTHKWFQEDYLKKYMQICLKYYSEDELLQSSDYTMAFSSWRKLVCIGLKNDLVILQLKTKQFEKVDFFLKMKLRIDMGWKEIPYSISIECPVALTLMYADHEKVGCIQPLDYHHLKRKIRQNQNNPITNIYSTSQGYSVLISKVQGNNKLKLYLAKF